MDPALIKEREAFLKRAKATPQLTDKRKAKPGNDENDKKAKKARVKPTTSLDYKTSQGSSQYNFSVLAKIIKFLKSRHQGGARDPLLLEEILDETSQLDITSKMKHWLATEALVSNPKVIVLKEDGINKFYFKPKFDIQNKKGLVRLLKNYDLHGKGGILIEDIEESLPNIRRDLEDKKKEKKKEEEKKEEEKKAEKTNQEDFQDDLVDERKDKEKKEKKKPHQSNKDLKDQIKKENILDYIITVKRPQDKKEVLFYNDRYCQFTVAEEFQKLWRSFTVEGLDDQKIEEYLSKQGITSMEASGYKKVSAMPRRKKGKQKPRSFKKHNDHLNGVLEDYSENPPGK
ncbi:Transcription initiation factor IIE subunit beta [Bulinus truncatus]|nr:Transcription initiation factor IIE subunit beta [Bulinus truncatus]